MTPTNDQAKAIAAIVTWYKNPKSDQVFLLDGGAGTGKTTIIKFITDALKLKRVSAAAYTGKAARVMRRKGVAGARTLHSLIYRLIRDEGHNRLVWALNEESDVLNANLVVLDEVSMVSHQMASDLLSFGKKVLVIGDVRGQLPPIEGTGAFEQRPPDYRLTELHRTAADSPVVRLAYRALHNKPLPLMDNGDVWVVPWNRGAIDIVSSVAPGGDRVLICGRNATRHRITRRYREQLGIADEWRPPISGEPLICCRNNYDFAILNGMGGYALADTRPDKKNKEWLRLDVQMEEEAVALRDIVVDMNRFQQSYNDKVRLPRTRRNVCEFDWAYALTCHKAQGSEWADVVVFAESGAFRENANRWLYTALTRSCGKLTVFV